MARPKKSADEKRKKRIPIAFSDKEFFSIKEKAEREHLPVGVWIRQKVLGFLNNKGQRKGRLDDRF